MNPIRLVQITDTHLFGEESAALRGVATLPALRAVLAHAAPHIEAADALLVTGDIVQDDSAGYRHFRETFAALDRPVLVLPGNHDEPALLREALHGHPAFQFCGHRDIAGWRIVLLDSVLPGSASGRLSAGSLATLDRLLGECRDRHALVCLHHHPVSMSSQWLDEVGLENAADFFRIVDRHAHVRGIVWGHVHQSMQAMRGGIHLLSTPSTCVQFAPQADDFAIDPRPPGYRILQLDAAGGIQTEVVWLDRFAADASSPSSQRSSSAA